MRPSGLYMAFQLKLMFSLFAGSPKQNLKPKCHLTKGRINELVRQFRCNILQMKNRDFRNLPLSLQGWRIDLGIQYFRCLSCMKLFCCLNKGDLPLSKIKIIRLATPTIGKVNINNITGQRRRRPHHAFPPAFACR